MQFDVWMIIVAIIGVVGLAIAMAVVSGYEPATHKGFIAGVAVLWLFGYGVSTLIVSSASMNAKPSVPTSEPLTYSYVAQEMGLDSGQAYPLVLGSRAGGSAGETDVTTSTTAGLFSARSTTTMQSSTTPASAVSLGYSYEGKTYILEMPTSRITFLQSETKEPSVTIWLNGAVSSDLGSRVYSPYSETKCKWTFNNILWMCLWPDYVGESTPIINQHILDVGLVPVVQGGFDRATITLTPEMYRQLLGIIE